MNVEIEEVVMQNWNQGRSLDAGRVLFENVPRGLRPFWAVRILDLIYTRMRLNIISPETEKVIACAQNHPEWTRAKEVFRPVRRKVLELEKSGKSGFELSLLMLSELTAKITYNETEPFDEFDEDTGWYFLKDAIMLTDMIEDRQLSLIIWDALFGRT
ncbi:MAG: hypothetical protein ABI579_05950 [Candidatus Sumerlaeota bacterium]